jgi:hypothetical protein
MPNSPLFAIPLLTGGSDYPTPDQTADAKLLNDQVLAMEKFLGITICTSGTRPSSPKKQQIIVESDTGLAFYYSGTAWVALYENIDRSTIPTGNTTERDAFYGSPATAAARKTLANRASRWSNNTTGWMEQYFAQSGDTANSQVTIFNGAGSGGWYPIAGMLPSCGLSSVVAQSVADSVDEEMVFGVTDWITPGMTKVGDKIKVTYAGIYQVSGRIAFAVGVGARVASLRVNGAQVSATGTSIAAHGYGNTAAAFSMTYDFKAGDEISLNGRASATGGNLNVVEKAFSVTYLRPPRNG